MRKRRAGAPEVAPDIEELLATAGFRDPSAARRRVHELFRDAAEMLALARVSGLLRDVLRECPDADAALLHLVRLVEVRGARLPIYRLFLDHPALLDRFVHVVGSSRYLADVLVRNPEYLEILSDSAALCRLRPRESLRRELRQRCRAMPTVESRLDAMRRVHRREVLRIGAADLLGFQDLGQVTLQISDLADAFVERALALTSERRGGCGLIVLALGKWGGRELNYSSDIDVIFLARRAGDVPGATRQAQRLLRVLGEPTAEGVVYRVDVRLRPHGREGSLVLTPRMFEAYLRSEASPPERQMMLKARAAAGDVAAGGAFLRRIRPLLLRDSRSARDHVRSLKSRIERQLRETGEEAGHVKLAPGGIRDVEFLVQALQLESGPSRPQVLGGNTLDALGKLLRAGVLAADDAGTLRDAYLFHRAAEHRLQLMENQQVHRLPRGEGDLRRLARTLGLRGEGAGGQLLERYEMHSRRVRALFDRLLAGSSPERPGVTDREQELRRRLGTAAQAMDPERLRWCAGMLGRVEGSDEVALRARPIDEARWTVALSAAVRSDLLLLVTGLFAARRINILGGEFVNLAPARDDETVRARTRGPARGGAGVGGSARTLGIFEVSVPARVSAASWAVLRSRLADLVTLSDPEAARASVLEEVAGTLRPSPAPDLPLLPVRVEMRPSPSSGETEIHIRSRDTLGFLFEFATALDALAVEVHRAVIRTIDDEVYDTFWVTGRRGRKITGEGEIAQLRAAVALIKQFTHLLPRSPDPAQSLRQFTALFHQMSANPGWLRDLRSLESPTVLTTLADLMGVSRFLWEEFLLLQHENLFPVVRDVPALDRRPTRARMERDLSRAQSGAGGFEEAVRRLNEFKDREMFRIDLRHITRRSDFPGFMSSLSDLAEVVVRGAARLSVERLRGRFGDAGPFCVAALGKLGGRELGLASDLDLVFVYERDGMTTGLEKVPHARVFAEVVKSFRDALRARREGSFEVDLRLRPHGEAGALACSLDGFERYYADGGPARQFERMALVKLVPVAGDPSLGARLVAARDGFVYSGRPLDYGEILHLRRRQATELVAPGDTHAKYGPGGLADVEYFVQARQIEAGGRDPSVRLTGTLEAVRGLVRGGHLRKDLGDELSRAYLFLRRLIDALRVVRGYARDSQVPPRDRPEFAYLVRRLGAGSPTALEAEIRQHMSFARNLWSEANLGGG